MNKKLLLLLVSAHLMVYAYEESADSRGCNSCNNSTVTFQNLFVTGLLTTNALQVTGPSVLNDLTLADPVIALTGGGNLLDYGYFSTLTAQVITSGNSIILDNTPVNSAGITVSGDTITFVNTGIYLISAYIVGSFGGSNAGFEFSFTNPAGGNRFSGGATGVVNTLTGSAIVACDAGRTMTLVNISNGALTLSTGGVVGTTTANLTILRIQ